MAMLAFAHGEKWELYLATAIMGVGFGLAYAAMSSLIVAAVPPEQTGVASGMNANIRTIGGSIGAALMASMVTSEIAARRAAEGDRVHHRLRRARRSPVAAAALAAIFIPRIVTDLVIDDVDEPSHPELAVLAGGHADRRQAGVIERNRRRHV